MADQIFEFLLPDTGAGAATVEAAVAGRYRICGGPARRQTRQWLDTFDGRLRSAGMTLAQVRPAAPARAGGRRPEADQPGPHLVLTTQLATVRQPAATRCPALLTALPPGPVRDTLTPVVDIRALLPLATVDTTVSELRLCNEDDKTVIRAWLDHPGVPAEAGATGGRLPTRLRLQAVRGYGADAARAARMLTATDGVHADPPTELDLLADAGLLTGAGPRRSTPRLRPGADARTSVAVLLLHLFTVVEDNLDGTIADLDTEFLHDLRVAVRRTRSALKLAGDALPDDLATRYAPQFKWLGDLTTPMRDLDVLLLDFDELTAALVEADPTDLQPLRAHLRRQRTLERRRLRAGLRSAAFAELATGWRAALTPLAEPGRATGRRGSPDAGTPTAALAQRRIGRAWRQAARRATALTADSPAEAVHDLRKRCKELRYVLELFAGVCHPGDLRAVVKDLKVVQDQLGAFQDAEVHRDAVRGYAQQMLTAGTAPAATMLAMGELVARFGQRQRAAGTAARARVGALVTDANQRRIARLVPPA